jgi:hypothetical protein
MIIRRNASTLLLITQPDHAALAGRVMREWERDGWTRSARRDDILRAVAEHDNGWREVDRSPVRRESDGRPLDFVEAPDEIRQGVWPRGVERLADTPYSAALVAQHAVHVYSRYRGHADWTRFFSGMESLRDSHLARVPDATLDELLRDYLPVRIGDLISLVFCNLWKEPQREGEYEIALDGDRVVIAPDPFGGRTIPLEIEARELPDRPLISDAEARRAFDAAPRRLISGAALGAA